MSSDSVPPPLPPAFIPPAPPPPPLQPEQVRLVLKKIIHKTGLFSKQAFRLLLTDQRLIFVVETKNNIDYSHQDPNISLAENPGNFSIPVNSINKIEIYHGDFESNSPDSLVIKSSSSKMTFEIQDAYRVSQSLKQVLGNLVK